MSTLPPQNPPNPPFPQQPQPPSQPPQPPFMSQSGPLLPPQPARLVPPPVRGEPMNLKRWWETASKNARIGLGCATLIFACGCCSLAALAANSGSKTTTPTTQQATNTPSGTATPTFTPGPTATPTATATPKPTATPTHAPQWQTVNTFKGNGISKTATFTVNASQWKITWSCNPQAYGFEYNLIAELTKPGASYGDPVVNVICKDGDPSTTSGETMEYTTGTFYLDVNSEATWQFDIQVLQ